MPINDTDLLAAVSAGIANEAAPAVVSTTDDNTESDENANSNGDSDADGGNGEDLEGTGGTPGAGSDPDKPADAELDAEGKPKLDADGKPIPKAKTDDKKPLVEETPEAKAVREAAEAAAAAKPKDPVTDPIDPRLKKDTRERMEKLVGLVKEKDTNLAQVTGQLNEVMGLITESKATPTQYGQALDYLRLVNSGDPIQMKAALGVMQREIVALARLLGEPVAGVDLLSEHEDLRTAVDDGTISREHAEELAAARAGKKTQTEQSQRRNTTDQASHEYNTALTKARTDMNVLGLDLAKNDAANYDYKKGILLKTLQPILAKLHPSDWPATFKAAYDAIPVPAAVAKVIPKAPSVPANQPMRMKNPAGGQQAEPKSLFEAIDNGLAMAGGR